MAGGVTETSRPTRLMSVADRGVKIRMLIWESIT